MRKEGNEGVEKERGRRGEEGDHSPVAAIRDSNAIEAGGLRWSAAAEVHMEMERRIRVPPGGVDSHLVRAAEGEPGGDVCEGTATACLKGWEEREVEGGGIREPRVSRSSNAW